MTLNEYFILLCYEQNKDVKVSDIALLFNISFNDVYKLRLKLLKQGYLEKNFINLKYRLTKKFKEIPEYITN